MTYTNTITSKGQITIPKEFRDKLGLDKTRRAQLRLNKKGEIVITRTPTLEETEAKIRAILAKPSGKQPLTDYERERGEYLATKYNVRL